MNYCTREVTTLAIQEGAAPVCRGRPRATVKSAQKLHVDLQELHQGALIVDVAVPLKSGPPSRHKKGSENFSRITMHIYTA